MNTIIALWNGTEIRYSNLSPICSWLPVKAMMLTRMEYALVCKGL